MPDPVESLYIESSATLDRIAVSAPSLQTAVGATLAKCLVLAAASSFETELNRHLLNAYEVRLRERADLVNFVRNAAIERRYFSHFDWDGPNANKFFALFGPERAQQLKAHFSDEEPRQSMRDFMQLGQLRNKLIHNDFATFPWELSLHEVHERYISARSFLDAIRREIA